MSEEEAVNPQQQQQQGSAQESDPCSQEKEEAIKEVPDADGKSGADAGKVESTAAEEAVEQSGSKEEQGESPPPLPADGEKAEVKAQAEDGTQEDTVREEMQYKEEPVPQTVVQPIEDTSAKGGDERQNGDEQLQRNEGVDDKEQPPKSTAEEDEGPDKLESQFPPRGEKTGAESTSEMEGHPPKAADKLELQSSAREERTAGESTSEMEGHLPKTADKKKKKKPKSRGEPGDSKPMPRLKRKSSRLESAGRKSLTGSIATTDLFDDTVRDMFSIADTQQKGHLTREEFESFLQLEHFSGCLDQSDYTQSLQYFDSSATDGQLAYDMFAPVARELILRVYQVRDTSGSDWVQLSTSQGVNFWLNKFTGETRVVDEAPLADRQQEIDFMNQVYSQLDTTQTELDQERSRSKDLANQIYHLQEEMEKAHEALYTTGQTLDDTSAELQAKNSEIDKLTEVLEAKEADNQKMQERIAELELLAEKVHSTKRELDDAKSLVSRQEGKLVEKDAALTQLQYKCDSTAEQLKSATGMIDARESSVRKLTKALDGEKRRVKEFEHHVPQVEEKLKSTEEELAATKHQLEEKIRALQTTRKQLKSTRDRNMELEKDVEKLLVVKEKCVEAEGEIRTLKSFLVSKTSLVEKKKNEMKELQAQMMEMEKKDEKRAIILASVLEKTARMQQLASEQHVPPHDMSLHRSTSAPSLLPDAGEDTARLRAAQSKRKAHTTSKVAKPWTTGPPPHTSRTGRARKKGKKAHTLPRLPPLMSSQSDKKEFSFPTPADIKHSHKLQDAVVVEHSSSNPTCHCAMCMLHESASTSVAEAGLPTAAAMTGLSGLGSLAKQHGDEREVQLSKKLHLGDRVIVQMKRTMYDLEPRKVTGTVKYVGKVDSEYVDNRIYVGVRLDDPVGDSDGLFKGKRYFTCTAKHGKMVRINNVIAVLYPKMGTAYQPLVCPQQKTPYNLGTLAGDTMMQLPVK